jgi:hypothetical protein
MFKKGFALLMILPLCFVLFNNTVNRHQHQLPGGMVVEHAHPLSSCCSEGKSHGHSDLELLLYLLISDSPVDDDYCILSPLFIPCFETDLKSGCIQIAHTLNSHRLSLLRAPPLS